MQPPLTRPYPSRRSMRSLLPVLMAAGLVSLNLSACGFGKVAQCNTLSKEINKSSGLRKKFETVTKDLALKGDAIKDIKDFHKVTREGSASAKALGNELDGLISQIKAVEVKDEKLISYRDRTVSIYTEASQSFKNVGSVLEDLTQFQANAEGKKLLEASMKKLNTVMVDLKKGDTEEQAVTQDLNTYCGVNKTS